MGYSQKGTFLSLIFTVCLHIFVSSVTHVCVFTCSRYFFYEETEDSKVVKNIGNVTADSEVTFEYGVRTKQAEEKGKPVEKMEVEEEKG